MRLILRLTAAFHGHEHPPHNNKGGWLRGMVERAAHSPVFGMEIRSGRWWAHTAWGWHPAETYFRSAAQEGRLNATQAP